jgi:hypothetical protein
MLFETLVEFHVAATTDSEPICKDTLGAPEPIVAPAANVTSTRAAVPDVSVAGLTPAALTLLIVKLGATYVETDASV